MNEVIQKTESLKNRFEKAVEIINQPCVGWEMPDGYEEAIKELDDVILDFKTLSYHSDPNAPIHIEILDLPRNYHKYTGEGNNKYEDRVRYLLEKFIRYNAEK